MSEVHLARAPDGRRVAIKHVPAGGDPSHRRRLRREARTTARIDHETAVAILDVVDDDDGLWLVMEYVDGITLADEIAGGRLPAARALDIACQIADGLASAHSSGVLHRDLKGENVMLTAAGRVRLLDFGLAKALWSEDQSQTLTLHGEVMGTCRAMSPEQARGWRLDGRSDLFALGSLLYEMVTGQSPFQAKTPVATMNRVCTHEPPPAHLVETDVPRSVSQLITRLHRKKAEERPQDAQEARDLILETIADLESGTESRWPKGLIPGLGLLILLLMAGFLLENFDDAEKLKTDSPATEVASPPRGRGLPAPSDALVRSLSTATSASELEDIRRRSLQMLERYQLRLPGPEWDRTSPPIFLADTCRVLAAIDFELAAPDAAARWLDTAREVLIAGGRPPELEDSGRQDRELLTQWPSTEWVLMPLPPFDGCPVEIEAAECAPLALMARDLEEARSSANLGQLRRLAQEAAEAGFRRLELRARLERIRAAQISGRDAAELDKEIRELEEEASLRGLERFIDELRLPSGS